MARVHFASTAMTVPIAGRAVSIEPNATVAVYEAGTTTPIAQTLYAAHTGPTTLPNPFAADSAGNYGFYLDTPQDVRLVISGTGTALLEQDWVALPPGASDLAFLSAPTNTFSGKLAFTTTGRIIEAGFLASLINDRWDAGRRVQIADTKTGANQDASFTLVAVDSSTTSTYPAGLGSTLSVQTQYPGGTFDNNASEYMTALSTYSEQSRKQAYDQNTLTALAWAMSNNNDPTPSTHSNGRVRAGYFEAMLGSRHPNAYAGAIEATAKNANGQAATAFSGSMNQKAYVLALEAGTQLYNTTNPASALGWGIPIAVYIPGGTTAGNNDLTQFLTGIYFGANSYADYGIDFKSAGKTYTVASGAHTPTKTPGTYNVGAPIRFANDTYLAWDAGGTDVKSIGINTSNHLSLRNDARITLQSGGGGSTYAYFDSSGMTTPNSIAASGNIYTGAHFQAAANVYPGNQAVTGLKCLLAQGFVTAGTEVNLGAHQGAAVIHNFSAGLAVLVSAATAASMGGDAGFTIGSDTGTSIAVYTSGGTLRIRNRTASSQSLGALLLGQ